MSRHIKKQLELIARQENNDWISEFELNRTRRWDWCPAGPGSTAGSTATTTAFSTAQGQQLPSRPASVQPASGYSASASRNQFPNGFIDGYNGNNNNNNGGMFESDSSSHYARSESSTPIIDRETRAKINSVSVGLNCTFMKQKEKFRTKQ